MTDHAGNVIIADAQYMAGAARYFFARVEIAR
jgi:hypothetical protein